MPPIALGDLSHIVLNIALWLQPTVGFVVLMVVAWRSMKALEDAAGALRDIATRLKHG